MEVRFTNSTTTLTHFINEGCTILDWDGDGLCDVLSLDRHTGNVDLWRNTYKSGNAVPTFDYVGQVVGGSHCTEGWGLGLYDLGLRFADIDGDKRVDFLKALTPLPGGSNVIFI